jgi:hypothetical protein
MSEELNAMRAQECFEELYGVDGDGLGEGEGSCEADFEPLGLELEQNPGHREKTLNAFQVVPKAPRVDKEKLTMPRKRVWE